MTFWKWLLKIPYTLKKFWSETDDGGKAVLKGVGLCFLGIFFFAITVVILPFPLNLISFLGWLGILYMFYTMTDAYWEDRREKK